MISLITGTLLQRDGETLLVLTSGGVGYEVTVPLGVLERMPANGSSVSLYTELVVREDSWSLYGFDRTEDRAIFQRLLGATGFGPRLALALLSTLGPERAVRSIQQRDIAALSTVPGIGRKKAEKLVVELGDRFKDATPGLSAAPPGPAEAAVQALARLGYAPAQAEEAVGAVLGGGALDTARLIRDALQRLAGKR